MDNMLEYSLKHFHQNFVPVFAPSNQPIILQHLQAAKKGVASCRENLLTKRCLMQDSVQYKRTFSMIAYSNDPIVLCIKQLLFPPEDSVHHSIW